MLIGEKLKELRIKAGLSQKELADKINKTPQYVSQYESGKRYPRQATLQLFGDALGVDLNELLYYAESARLEQMLEDKRQMLPLTPDTLMRSELLAAGLTEKEIQELYLYKDFLIFSRNTRTD